MTKEVALKQLFSSAAHDRLIAARFLARHAEPQDSEIISQALRQEDVLWTQTALRDALNRISPGRATADQPAAAAMAQAKLTDEKEDITDQEIRDLYSRAVQESTSLLVHELEPILGALSVFAKLEIPDFEQSKTKRHLDLFDEFLSTILEFRKASTQPTYSEFDLAALIRDLVPNETTGSLVTVQFAGKGPFLVEGDRTRLWIAIKNGLNNAVEATERVDPPEIRSPVVVNWNKTDVDYWVSILDEGIGLRSNVERIFDIGTTTKKDHFGMGLPMARQALMSMGGDIHLTPRDKVGVKFELRWPRLRREAV